MKNKKGFLLTEETLKIVIAVIGLTILIYFLVTLFYSNIGQEKQRQAASTIEGISDVISVLDLGQREVYLLQPKGWTMFSFVGEIKKPNSCFGEDCICICDEVNVDTLFGLIESRQLKECSKNGACTVVDNLESFESFEIKSYQEGTTNINISKEEGKTRVIEIK